MLDERKRLAGREHVSLTPAQQGFAEQHGADDAVASAVQGHVYLYRADDEGTTRWHVAPNGDVLEQVRLDY